MRRTIRKYKKILSVSLAVFIAVGLIGLSFESYAAKKSSSSTYKAGDDIAFGVLDGTVLNWTILSYDDTTKMALIISRKSLNSYSVRTYRKAVNDLYLQTGTSPGYVHWSSSYWRGWLNGTFYSNCFTDTEKAMIKKTTLTAEDHQKSIMNFYHDTSMDAYYLNHGEKNSLNMSIYNNQVTSKDNIFFLSFDEYNTYKDTMKYEILETWPLRTNAYDDPAQGLYVNDKTKLIERNFFYKGSGIRPAMYVQLGTPEEKEDSTTNKKSADTTDTKSTDSSSTKETSSSEKTSTSSSSTTATTKTENSSTSVKKKSYANNGTDIGNINLPEDSSYSMSNGSTAQVALNMAYLNSTDKEYTVTYKSSDASVFTVDANGLITANSVGTGTLTVRMKKSNGKVYSMTCRIDVK